MHAYTYIIKYYKTEVARYSTGPSLLGTVGSRFHFYINIITLTGVPQIYYKDLKVANTYKIANIYIILQTFMHARPTGLRSLHFGPMWRQSSAACISSRLDTEIHVQKMYDPKNHNRCNVLSLICAIHLNLLIKNLFYFIFNFS